MNLHAFMEFLVSEGVIPPGKVASIEETASMVGERVDTTILDFGLCTEELLLAKLGEFSNSRICSGEELDAAETQSAALISPRVALRFGVVPFRKVGRSLDVAALDPEDFLIQDELRVLTGCLIRSHAVLEIRLRQTLARLYGVELPVRQEALIRRLNKGGSGVTPPAPQSPPPRRTEPGARPIERKISSEVSVKKQPREEKQSPAPRRAVTPSELEISEEDLKLFPSLLAGDGAEETGEGESIPTPPPLPTAGDAELDGKEDLDLEVEIRLARAAELLQSAEMRDDIGDALFYFCRPYFARRILLSVRKDLIVGWRGEGEGMDETAVRAIAVPRGEPSVFVALMEGAPFCLGPLPPMARNQELIFAMGPPEPSSCLVLPVQVRGRTVAFFYGDPGGGTLPTLPMAELKRLMAKADVAFQVYLLKGKIRTL